MRQRLMKGIIAALVTGMLIPLTVSAAEILGSKPGHIWGRPSHVENEKAISKMIWAPGIDDGYVPQGVAWADGIIYVTGYRSTDTKTDTAPCRIFKVDAGSGKVLAHFDLPEECKHAGGLAYIGDGTLIISDTRRLYRLDVAAAFSPGKTSRAVTGNLALSGTLKGSFVGYDGSAIFIGTYHKDSAKAKGYFLPLSIFDVPGAKRVDNTAVIRSVSLPTEAQGAAFDKDGGLWITSSNSRGGHLHKLDAKTGRMISGYEMMSGMEGISFDDRSGLWSVSEAGSLRWREWKTVFPLLFRLDTGKLE